MESGTEEYDFSGVTLMFQIQAVDSSQQQVATGTHSRVLSRERGSPRVAAAGTAAAALQ